MPKNSNQDHAHYDQSKQITHQIISTVGFTIPVTSPDKSVVNFSRS